jgi:hypothetical protein
VQKCLAGHPRLDDEVFQLHLSKTTKVVGLVTYHSAIHPSDRMNDHKAEKGLRGFIGDADPIRSEAWLVRHELEASSKQVHD